MSHDHVLKKGLDVLLLEEDLKVGILDIVKLMKLGLYGRMSENGVNIIEKFLKKTCAKNTHVSSY